MKNLILIIVLSLVFTNCKKKEVTPKVEVYCCFVKNGNTKSFYKCASSQAEMQKIALEIRDNNLGSLETSIKASCSECN